MNVITDILLLFVYLTTLFYFRFPDITNTNYLFHKLIIFISVFVFKFVIELGKKIKENKKVDPIEILKESSNFSLYNILGYSLYIDMMYMNIPYENLAININSDNQRFFIASTIMTIVASIIGGVGGLFMKT